MDTRRLLIESANQASRQTMQHFYSAESLATIVGADDFAILMNAAGTYLAQRSASHDPWLFKSDCSGSVIGGIENAVPMPNVAYTPYGYALGDIPLAVVGFNGQWRDPVLHGYHLGNGHRLFRPHLQLFSQSDALSPFGKGGVNSYAYCGGDPINRTDPSGRWFLRSKGVRPAPGIAQRVNRFSGERFHRQAVTKKTTLDSVLSPSETFDYRQSTSRVGPVSVAVVVPSRSGPQIDQLRDRFMQRERGFDPDSAAQHSLQALSGHSDVASPLETHGVADDTLGVRRPSQSENVAFLASLGHY